MSIPQNFAKPASSKRFPILCLAVLVLLTLCATLPLTAGELAGVTMDDTVQVGEERLVLNGQGLRKKAIFKVYVGGLYLPEKQNSASTILGADTPRRMVLHFVRSVGADSISGAWDDCLKANRPNASTELRQNFSKLSSWMDDVKSGERLVFTYVPDEGTSVEVKGAKKGLLAGQDFGDTLFACWIGAVPPSEDFKKGLLGG